MSDGYNVGNTIQTNAEGRIEAFKAIAVATLKFIYNTGMEMAERLIPMGASEIAGALIPSSAVVQNHFDDAVKQDAPAIESPIPEQSQSQEVKQPQLERTHDYTPSQSLPTRSEGLSAYMSGNYEQPIYTPSTRAESVSAYMSGNYAGNGDPVKAEMTALSIELREDYAARAAINAMQVEPNEPERGISR